MFCRARRADLLSKAQCAVRPAGGIDPSGTPALRDRMLDAVNGPRRIRSLPSPSLRPQAPGKASRGEARGASNQGISLDRGGPPSLDARVTRTVQPFLDAGASDVAPPRDQLP